ncbi:MAG: high-potential iron-sulfur protein [Sandaracinus sp.]
MPHDKHSRRVMLQVLGAAGAGLFALPVVGCSGGGGGQAAGCNELGGVDVSTRNALHYVANGPDAARHCSSCTLFAGTPNGCGTCQAFPGPVDPNGSCDSFVART